MSLARPNELGWSYRRDQAELEFGPGDSSGVLLKKASGKTYSVSVLQDSDVERGAALQTALASHSAGDEVIAAPGTALISALLTIKSGTKLRANNTTLKLANQVTTKSGYLIASSETAQVGSVVEGFLFDCNLQNQSGSNCSLGAVKLSGSQCEVRNSRAINWGNTGSGQECFVFGIENNVGDGTARLARIISCVVDTPANVVHGSAGTTAFDIFGQGQSSGGLTTVGDGWIVGGEITGCTCRDILTGAEAGKPYFFHGFTLGSTDGAMIHNNFAYNLRSDGNDPYKDCTAFYIDTWSARRVGIFNNHFLNVAKGIFLNSQASYIYDNWMVLGNHIDLNDDSGGVYGIFWTGPATMTGGVVANNIVNASGTYPIRAATAKRFNNQTSAGVDLDIETISGHGAGGAITLGYPTTTLTNDGTSNLTATLAAGTNGQVKTLVCLGVSGGFSCVVTVTNLLGGTTITLDTAGDTITLKYLNSKWTPLSNIGAAIA